MAAVKLRAGSPDNSKGAAIANGIAHVSFPGGSIFLPARSPYDRQMLIEHIVQRARAKERVQVLMGGLRWMVHLCRETAPAHCSTCDCVLNSTCYSTAENDAAYCLGCAFGDYRTQVQSQDESQRTVES